MTAISDHLRGGVSWAPGSSTITWQLTEKDPAANGEWHRLEIVESMPFTVTALGAREGGREVYIAGVKRDGKVVIEKWLYGARPKGWALAAPAPAAPMGQPMPEFVPVESLNGTGWSAPKSTVPNPAVRSTYWSSSNSEVISALNVDPEGRYAIGVTYPSGNVLQFDLTTPNSIPQLIFSAADDDYLQGVTVIDMWHHSTEGRMVILTKRVGGWTFDDNRAVIRDSNNDGAFEALDVLSGAEWDAADYSKDDSFRKYWNAGVEFDWDE